MNNDRTRLFEAKYTSSDKKTHDLKVRVFSHLRYFGLSLALVGTLSGCIVPILVDANNERDKSSIEETMEDENKAFIESIIREDPYRLETYYGELHTVEMGELISTIAEDYGMSVKKICAANDIEPTTIIRPGDKLKVTRIERLEGLDEDIVCLETYFYDYLFKTKVVEEAKKNTPSYIASIIYGEPNSETELDPNSAFGRYVHAYYKYHEDGKEHSEEEKKEYVEELLDIESSVVPDINSYLGTNVVTPYSQFKIYMKNGNTKSDDLIEKHGTVYD